ncbi:MAG: Maf family protein [Ardenticatenales bacterium]|nr:Maf family protein [Ardenticatenales bacterium]
MNRVPILLASASPRRRALLGALLADHGLPLTVVAVDVDESIPPDEAPAAAAVRLALAKAMAIAASAGGHGARVIGADTIVVARDGDSVGFGAGSDERGPATDPARHPTILGKPRDAAEAAAFLRRLRGRRHDVITGIAVVDAASGARIAACATTAVWMRSYSDGEIAAYVASGDPLDKAGGYAIQHRGFHPVAALAGSEANVIGLPVGLLGRLLGRMMGWSGQ